MSQLFSRQRLIFDTLIVEPEFAIYACWHKNEAEFLSIVFALEQSWIRIGY